MIYIIECNIILEINVIVFSHQQSLLWARVPMVCSKIRRCENKDSEDGEDDSFEEPWQWWSNFHERLEWDKKIGVVLEISANLPSQEIIKRWLGEPIKAIILPTAIFHTNKKG